MVPPDFYNNGKIYYCGTETVCLTTFFKILSFAFSRIKKFIDVVNVLWEFSLKQFTLSPHCRFISKCCLKSLIIDTKHHLHKTLLSFSVVFRLSCIFCMSCSWHHVLKMWCTCKKTTTQLSILWFYSIAMQLAFLNTKMCIVSMVPNNIGTLLFNYFAYYVLLELLVEIFSGSLGYIVPPVMGTKRLSLLVNH